MQILLVKVMIVTLLVIPMLALIGVACVQYERLAAQDAAKQETQADARAQALETGGLSRWELRRTTAAAMRYDRRRQKRLAAAARYR